MLSLCVKRSALSLSQPKAISQNTIDFFWSGVSIATEESPRPSHQQISPHRNYCQYSTIATTLSNNSTTSYQLLSTLQCQRMASRSQALYTTSDNGQRQRGPVTRISAILFDLDNTLIPTRKADELTAVKISEKISRDFGIPLSVAREASDTFLRRFRRNVENPRMTLDDWRLFLWVNALGEEYEEFAEDIYAKWKRMRYRHLAVTESTLSLLRTLRNEYQLALVTNGPSQSQWEKIRELKLEEYFDYVVVSGDIGCEKPETKFFQTVFSSMGIGSYECLMVGDRLDTDILGGLGAGIGHTVWLPMSGDDASKMDPEGLSPQPDFIISEISELLGLLGRSKRNERSKTSKSPPKQLSRGKAGSSGQSSSSSSTSSSRFSSNSVDDDENSL